ncbi:MAG: carbohydrate deacetylase [Steroidobacteraceae bacterium]
MDVQTMTAGLQERPAIRMVVNADDFGYFDQVSRGIIEAMEQGVVTATGVMANGPALARWVGRLKALPAASVGVHLNVTLGEPLTAGMKSALAPWRGEFPGKGTLVAAVLRGRIAMDTVLQEWRAQIERCLEAGLKLEFLNSHEHIHMLPSLYSRTRELANEFNIPHVRAPRAEWGPKWTVAGCVRSSVFAAVRGLVPKPPCSEPELIGLASSGRLDHDYFEWRFARLERHKDYELMCHPGWQDPQAQAEPKLAAYHDWEGELQALMNADFVKLLAANRIVLSSYADLDKSHCR